MSRGEVEANEELWRALGNVARAERSEEVERLVSGNPSLVAQEFLDQLDRKIDEGARTGRADWWGLTRARVLLGGYHEGALQDALFRCWTRDLLPLGPDDVRRRVAEHAELLGERADGLLRYWASQERAAGRELQAQQIELRRALLRELAAARMPVLVSAAMDQEEDFESSGDLAKLDEALATRRYLARDPGAPFVSVEVRAGGLQGISRLLQKRFRAAGVLSDIEDAVAAAEEGIAALPEDHPFRRALLCEVGSSLDVRFRELRAGRDIDRAIEIFDALAAYPDTSGVDSEDLLTPKVNLATAYLDRYHATHFPGDLSRCIDIMRSLVSATLPESPRRYLRVNNLGSALYLAYRDRGDQAALRDAIRFQREAVETKDATLRIHAMAALARSLDAAQQVGEPTAQDAAPVFRQACSLGLELNIGAAMWAGMTWGRGSWARGDFAAAAEAYGYCSDGARLLFSGQGRESSQEIRLSQFREVAARAAFALTHVGRVDDAVRVFELSRAQLLSQALERGSTLRHVPDLDEDVETKTLTKPLVAHPVFDIDDIVAAAEDTPILYLIPTDRGGLGLLVCQRKVTPIPLPELNAQAVAEQVDAYLAGLASPKHQTRVNALDTTTAWLWNAAMGTVLQELRGADALVVVPGGLLGLLPLHAAWTTDVSGPSGRRYALDLILFSYVPSARSLVAARERGTQQVPSETSRKVVIVADPVSAAAKPLPYAEDEADIVAWHFPQADIVRRNEASMPKVSRLWYGAELVHLACHGFADLHTPLQSGLVLAGDEVLRLRQLRDLRTSARLAVLSACETGVAGTRLPDEVVSMPTGLLQAGVAGIVASLWRVSDRATTMLMAEFYRCLCREKQAPPVALRSAQQWLRDTTADEKRRAWKAGAGDWLPIDVAERLCALLDSTAPRGFLSPWWWAAFIHVGSESVKI